MKLVKDPTFKPHRVDELLTHCTFHTKRSSVSTDTTNTEKAIDYIREHYVETEKQAHNFNINASYILAYPHIMNLSRKAAYYYFDIFKQTKSIKQLVIAMIVLISPELALNLKRFM
ncbi:glycosyl transferase, family 2 protein-1 [Rodentibacter pneumotropicus]|uniref:Glycosyl transferase, family 2 protein-1 n=1 Tax=Rodentibacter pneumotropicus TaxID=758 RepID=A0A3S4Y1E9_9PAST|nr:glycosyl transferase, family 2 protein-1 [Rodentibacter pneumotropicus]